MSNLDTQDDTACACREGDAAIVRLIHPHEKDLGEFTVRRSLPHAQQPMVGPWIFFDHMGPAEFPAGKGVNVRPHPHIHLATVSYLFEGEILHRDSLGSLQAIRPGDLNLMVAGRGIVHSERERPEVTASVHRLHGLQLWLALPEAHESTEPEFLHYPEADIPRATVDGVPVRVMMGSAYGVTSPVKTFAETLYIEATLTTGQTLTMPDTPERALYVAEGGVQIAGEPVAAHEMAVLRPGAEVTVEATADSRVALVGGAPLGKRFIEWNFVSSRREAIDEAKANWAAGRFPKVPGDEEEFIPYP